LLKLLRQGKKFFIQKVNIDNLVLSDEFANYAGSLAASVSGAVAALPTLAEVQKSE
jgi:fructokinase